ncbi:uncharacterized protein HRG_11699 [Hirsutella rhossiliensis]|uniref:Uncharacterized protein n=1 Tax=Hirsutella rhossiliensis TaxID=111463 RepID=A0A9P8MLB3_9HYPO|nr:uncharacterized protein HRG_11699 [Hirsutella rhossiliensis]KAH0957150.1 hypothetical protein HRG_11699 [Hirsutella rhossiliensis]
MIPWMSRSSSKKQAPGSPASRHISTVEISYEAYAYFAHDEDSCHRRATVQHFVLFVPWESFMCEEMGDINSIWARAREALAPRISCLGDIVPISCGWFDDQPKTQNATLSNGHPHPEMPIRRSHTWKGRDGRGGRRINSDVSVQTASETQRS